MSETNSLNFLDQTTPPPRATDDAAKAINTIGTALFERLGVGGTGEVYRFGDDALQRDLAIKILKAELCGNADAEERFLREARLTGSLQHPGIVPVHHLGQFADGRPCYTMKLVRGRTFADLLRDEPQGPERLPRLLAVLEKICQAVAYAHSKHVIHRDLKPSNVMVGEFGEVQVMDWGLAKELSRTEPKVPAEATEAVETAAWMEEGEGLSRAGLALGTPAYMPPEQAAGDWDIVDERADVFALGALLCEMLTGQPPYHGANRDDLLRRARRGDLAEALSRLEKCGADTVLVDLCRECLAAERLQRPRHASVVAERLAAYQAEVQERLRQTELERTRAEVKVLEERKRRRLLAVVALLVLLVVLGGGGGVWWWQQQRARADLAVSNARAQAELLAEQARADPLQTDKYRQALDAARVADQLAESASPEARQRTQELIARLEGEEKAARKDRELLATLLDVRGPHEGPKYHSDAKGAMMAMAEPTADEQFAAAFRRWGLDVKTTPTEEAAARLMARPAAVATEVIAALDEWANQLRVDKMPEAEKRVADLAAALEHDPGSLRRPLREILARGQLPMEQVLEVLSAALRPVPVPLKVPLGKDHRRLRQLAEKIDPASEPVLGLLTSMRALRIAGEEALAERLLRAAITAHPQEVVLYHNLGLLLQAQKPPRWFAVVECYRAARALRPNLGVTLAEALRQSGQEREALDLLAQLVKDNPDNPYLHFELGNALSQKGDFDAAIACYKKAIELDPKYAFAHNNLGGILCDHQRNYDGAIACFHKALELDPKLANAHSNLAVALHGQGNLDGAIVCLRMAIELDPKFAHAHRMLGGVLREKGDGDAAIACYRKAIKLDPNFTNAYNALGVALRDKGNADDAIACYKKAIELDPKYVAPHINIGIILCDIKHDYDGAIACFHKALDLDHRDAEARHNLAVALYGKGDLGGAIDCLRKAIELDPKYADAHYSLGAALEDKGDVDAAIDSYKKAIDLNPKHAKSYCNLGSILTRQGRFAEAVVSLRRGHELGSKQLGWPYTSAQWVREAEQMLVLDKKLPAILSGEESPANPDETVVLASLCRQPYKKHYAASARLYADAFAADPKLASDNRYNAACSAALAAARQGEDARSLSDKERSRLRRQALGWLRDDLAACAKLAEQNDAVKNKTIEQTLTHWRSGADLASVRDPQALKRLPETERAEWQALWRDVDKLANRTAK